MQLLKNKKVLAMVAAAVILVIVLVVALAPRLMPGRGSEANHGQEPGRAADTGLKGTWYVVGYAGVYEGMRESTEHTLTFSDDTSGTLTAVRKNGDESLFEIVSAFTVENGTMILVNEYNNDERHDFEIKDGKLYLYTVMDNGVTGSMVLEKK